MPRSKIPEGELVHFIVKTRYFASQVADFERNLGLIRNLANRMFRDHVGYTLAGAHRIKEKGEAVFAEAVGRDGRRLPRTSEKRASTLRHAGGGAFVWEGSRTLVLGLPGKLPSLERIDLILADGWRDGAREALCSLMRASGATLAGLPGAVEPMAALGLPVLPMHYGGVHAEPEVTIHTVAALSSEHPHAAGFVIEMDGAVVYHAGPSALCGEMRVVGDLFRVDAMTLRLGRSLPMSAHAAAQAADWVGARWVLPWLAEPGLGTQELQKELGELARVKLLGPNERLSLPPE